MKLKYAVVIEKAPNNYAAYAPDVLGCVSAATTRDETIEMMREAMGYHIELMLEDGDPLPEPRSSLSDAMRYHLEPLDESDDWEETETSFIMLEIEVVEPALAVAAAKSVAQPAAEPVGAAR